MKFKIDFYLTAASLDEGWRGTLNSFGNAWLITMKKDVDDGERSKTMLHELFHLFLFDQGVDDFDEDQKFDDVIIDDHADIFMIKYPGFAKNLWQYICERPKFHL